MVGGSWNDVENIHRIVVAHMPGYPVDSVVRVGAGLEHVAYEVNGELIVRFDREPAAVSRAERVQGDQHVLAVVAGISTLPVPEPAFVDPKQGCLAYWKLPGVPLLDMPHSRRLAHAQQVAEQLGDLLSALHAAPVDRMATIVETDDRPLSEWLAEAAHTYETVAERIPLTHRRLAEAFLGTPLPNQVYALVFSHNDLGIEHVLVNPLTYSVTGILDWSDAALVDPACDFGRLYRDLGPTAVDAALSRYYTSINDVLSMRERAAFYARCTVFEDLAYGIDTGLDKYIGKGLAALEWLFPPEQLPSPATRGRRAADRKGS